MSFATLQQRVNTTALKRLGGGTAITLAGMDVVGDFLQPTDLMRMDGVSAFSTQPTLTLPSNSVPPRVVGLPVSVNITDWKNYFFNEAYVVTHAKPDGFGLTVLDLEIAL